jgi:hypothetical protein
MSRRILLPLALGALLLGAVPALADANGSTEQRTVTRSCTAPADNQYSAPGPNDCKNGATTYRATHYTNNVKCGDKNSPTPANPTGIRAYGAGNQGTQSGGVGICSEGGSLPAAVPVQGRAGVAGSTSSGLKVTADGDRDNATPNGNETMHGWATVQVKPAAAPPTVTCGDEYSQGGRADSDAPQAGRDKQEECQG